MSTPQPRQGWLSHAHTLGAGSPATPHSGPSLLCGPSGTGFLLSLTLLASFPSHRRARTKRRGEGLSLIHATTQQIRAWAGSPMPIPLGPAHPQPLHAGLCCLGEGQGLLFGVLQWVRGRANSPTLMTLGPALLPAIFGKGQLVLTHVTILQTSDRGSSHPTHQGQLYCAAQARYRAHSPECCS